MSQNRKGEVSLELPSMFFPCGEKLSAPKKGQLSYCTVVQNLSLCWTACSQPKTIHSRALLQFQVTQENMLVGLLLREKKAPLLSEVTVTLSYDRLEEHLWV